MATVRIQEVTSPGCTMCAAAKKMLEEEIKPLYPDIEIEYIEWTEPEGIEMIQNFGIMIMPGIIVNGELLSFGGLTKSDLIKKIESIRSS